MTGGAGGGAGGLEEALEELERVSRRSCGRRLPPRPRASWRGRPPPPLVADRAPPRDPAPAPRRASGQASRLAGGPSEIVAAPLEAPIPETAPAPQAGAQDHEGQQDEHGGDSRQRGRRHERRRRNVTPCARGSALPESQRGQAAQSMAAATKRMTASNNKTGRRAASRDDLWTGSSPSRRATRRPRSEATMQSMHPRAKSPKRVTATVKVSEVGSLRGAGADPDAGAGAGHRSEEEKRQQAQHEGSPAPCGKPDGRRLRGLCTSRERASVARCRPSSVRRDARRLGGVGPPLS